MDTLSSEKTVLTAALTTAQLQLKEATPAGFAAETAELQRQAEAARQDAAAARAEAAAAAAQGAEAQRHAAEVRVMQGPSLCSCSADCTWLQQQLLHAETRPSLPCCRLQGTCGRRPAAWRQRRRRAQRGWPGSSSWLGRSARCASSWRGACQRATLRGRCR